MKFEDINESLRDHVVWTSEKVLYWYRYAWSILEKYKLTIAKNRYDEVIVWLRLAVLINLYRSFCDLCFEEVWENVYYIGIDLEDPNDCFILGQLTGEKHLSVMDEDYISVMVDKYKKEVYEVLCRDLSVTDIFNYMMITVKDEEIFDILTYEDYIKSIIFIDYSNDVTFFSLEGYNYLLQELPDKSINKTKSSVIKTENIEVKKASEAENTELPDEYYLFKNNLISILSYYISGDNIKDRETEFCKNITEYLNNYKINNNSSDEYAFSFVNHHDKGGCNYIDFHIVNNTITVSIGGSEYDESVGSDSFSDDIYYIQDDGFQEVYDDDRFYNLDDFGYGYINNGAKLSVEIPEDFDDEEITEDE